ncbi:hypothetical protein K1719_009125 [Acacia pycnantha]|nr:hypothetical protein K1719_009125 [Acacia pycnantha]
MNIETAHHHEEDKMRVLYEASYKGCVSTLNSLLQEDPGLLYKISSQTIFIETPLHISASHGHFAFTKTLLSHKPKLALERNSSQSTPLHLASAEGHIDIVKLLLEAPEEAYLVRDQEGRIPLHYAVIRGRKDVVLELIRAKAESSKILDHMGKTILHLCVTYNQLEILKELVNKLDTHGTHGLLIKGDLDGKNTILHLAIMLKQVETVRYLISIAKIRSEASNLKNDMGHTAADIVERIPKDSKGLEIQVILMKSGIKCGSNERSDVATKEDRSWRNVFKSIDECLVYKGYWLEEMRGDLSLVATVIATMTFQAALNPPGSFIQQSIRPMDDNHFNLTSSSNTSLSDGPLGCLPYKDESGRNITSGPCPGRALLAYLNPNGYDIFIACNTISFFASMIVVLLLVSGVPLKHRFVLRILSAGMTLAVTYLLSVYLYGLILINPILTTSAYPNLFKLMLPLAIISVFSVMVVVVPIVLVVNVFSAMVVMFTVAMSFTSEERSTKNCKSGDQGTDFITVELAPHFCNSLGFVFSVVVFEYTPKNSTKSLFERTGFDMHYAFHLEESTFDGHHYATKNTKVSFEFKHEGDFLIKEYWVFPMCAYEHHRTKELTLYTRSDEFPDHNSYELEQEWESETVAIIDQKIEWPIVSIQNSS